jgi:hypothetical protein
LPAKRRVGQAGRAQAVRIPFVRRLDEAPQADRPDERLKTDGAHQPDTGTEDGRYGGEGEEAATAHLPGECRARATRPL